jgi:hypothetical protein
MPGSITEELIFGSMKKDNMSEETEIEMKQRVSYCKAISRLEAIVYWRII